MRVLKFRIVSASEAETGVHVFPPMHLTAVFQNGSRTLTLVFTGLYMPRTIEVYRAGLTDFWGVPTTFTFETVREFVRSGWYVAD